MCRFNFVYTTGFARAIDHAPLQEHIVGILPLAEGNYWALVGMAGTLLLQTGDQYVQLAADCLRKAERIAGDERSKTQRANFFHLAGVMERNRGNVERVKALFLKSVRTNRSKRNTARQELQQLSQAGT